MITTLQSKLKRYLCSYRIKKIRDNYYVTPSEMVDNYIINNNEISNVNNELVGDFYIPYNEELNSPTTIAEKAFDGCDKLTSISMNSNIRQIGVAAFRKCSNLKSVTLSTNVTKLLINTFETCTSLSSIDLSSVTQIGDYCFLYNTSLSNIKLSDKLTYIGTSAFQYCNSLKTISMPNTVSIIGPDAFSHCFSCFEVSLCCVIS